MNESDKDIKKDPARFQDGERWGKIKNVNGKGIYILN